MVGNKIWPFIGSDRDASIILTKAFVCAWNTKHMEKGPHLNHYVTYD